MPRDELVGAFEVVRGRKGERIAAVELVAPGQSESGRADFDARGNRPARPRPARQITITVAVAAAEDVDPARALPADCSRKLGGAGSKRRRSGCAAEAERAGLGRGGEGRDVTRIALTAITPPIASDPQAPIAARERFRFARRGRR